jgi:hypothetical protein
MPDATRIIGDLSGILAQPSGDTFPAMLIASAEAEQPTLQDRLRCARVALRQAASVDNLEDARGWIETALRQIGE